MGGISDKPDLTKHRGGFIRGIFEESKEQIAKGRALYRAFTAVLFVMLVAIFVFYGKIAEERNQILHEQNLLIEACEKSLPRDKVCILMAVPSNE